MKNNLKSFFLCAMTVALHLMLSAQQAAITPQPSAFEVPVGETFEVTMQVDPAGEPLAVADLHMHFDPAYLEIMQVEVLSAGGFNVMLPAFNNAEGRADITAFQLSDADVVPAFELVKITFRALAETEHTSVTHPQDIFPRSILAFAGAELSAALEPIDVTITGSGALSTLEADASGLMLGVWPNPTNGVSFANFSADKGGDITVELYDATGKMMAAVFNGATTPGVVQRAEMNLSRLSDGVYFCRLITDHGTLVKRLVLSR